LLAEAIVLVMHVWLDKLLCMSSSGGDKYALGSPWRPLDHHCHRRIRTAFQLACALSAMKPLKLVFSMPFFAMRLLSSLQMIHWTFVSSDCMSHTAMVMTL
jgi:hypothetical protein